MKFAPGFAVLFSLLSVGFSSSAWSDSSRRTMHQRLSFDLNGDGRADAISLKVGENGNTFQLTVNGSTASGAMLDQITGFYIADINRADRFREVVVYTPGASDDDEHIVFWFDGKKLQRLAHLGRWVNYRGDGTLLVTDWAGFWQPKDVWTLTRNHQLRPKPRTFYPVNIKATTTKATPLRASIGGKTRGVVPANRAVRIVRSNAARTHYYVSAGNKSGWLSEAELYAHLTGMPVAD